MAKQLQRLQEYHMRAIDLRLQGYDYRQIADVNATLKFLLTFTQYRKIQEYKELGLTQTSQQILEYERRRLCKGS